MRERIGRPGYTIHDHSHTAAVHLARAGMPLHLLQQQLGHKNIDQTMRYARFHPDYGDVGAYFDTVGQRLGLGRPEPAQDGREKLRQAAELLGVDPDDLARSLPDLEAEAGNSLDNTPTQEASEEVEREAA